MKLDILVGLEDAAWPVLLVEGASAVCRPNQAARKLFGAALEGEKPTLSAIWPPENHSRPEQTLAQWERAPTPSVVLSLRVKGGATASCPASICAFHQDGRKYFLLQLLPEPAPVQPGAKPPGSDTLLFHKQKLDCALQLTRTLALDFNNALTSILGHTSLVLSKMEPNHPWRDSLLEVEKSAAKAAEITNDLGTFSRQEKENRVQAPGNLNVLLQRTIELFQQNAAGTPLAWSLHLDQKLFAAKFDEAKMQQAFVKILENSLQACPPGAGRVNITTRNIELTEPTQDRDARLSAGAYVCAEINDNGRGIEPEVLPRIFEPFFTTKHGPDHRGLGLAWVYGIVTNHGGRVAVSSQPGAGTSVRVYLPAEKKRASDRIAPPNEDLRGTQTILIVDDEELLLTMGRTILSAFGYRVLTANSGQKALDILAQKESRVDLVITDLVMPAMTGRELVERIRVQAPGTRVLCTSGYVWPAGQESESAYLQKPFTSQELLLKVKQALGS